MAVACNCKNRGLEKIAEIYQGCDRDVPEHYRLEFYSCCSCGDLFRRRITTRGDENITDICSSDFNRSRKGGWVTFCSDYLPYEGKLTRQEIADNLGTDDYSGDSEDCVLLKRKCDHTLEKLAESQPKTLKIYRGSVTEHTKYFECGNCGLVFYRDFSVGDAEANAWLSEMRLLGHASTEEEQLKRMKEGTHYNGHFLELELTKDEIIEKAPKCSGSAYYVREDIRKSRKK